ncbi:MAG: TIGR02253 family HAD-type hydrolase [Promethearchaeota archaeon]|nr:MAG: TIGR02253 family HAD-type hydrolase [Candidatus Lokiarchaeota archaeon]
MNNDKIKLIAFDLDDTLFNSTDLSEKARIRGIDAMIELGLKIEREKAINILMEIVEEYGSNFSYHYDYLFRRLEHTDNSFNISFDTKYKCIAGAVMAYHREKIDSIKLYDDVKDVLEIIDQLNLKMAIITDGRIIKQYEKVLRLKIDDLIDYIVVSDEIGIKKPNKKLFEYCLRKAKVRSKEAIYVGDRLDKDIKPALELGIYSVYIHRGGKHDFEKPEVRKPEIIKPDFEISNMRELIEIIKKINEIK